MGVDERQEIESRILTIVEDALERTDVTANNCWTYMSSRAKSAAIDIEDMYEGE